MSKVDAMRALREARAAAAPKAATKAAPKAAPAKAAPAKPAAASTRSKAVTATASTPADEPALCGHRSMNGRSCTRDLGHAEKNHRYG